MFLMSITSYHFYRIISESTYLLPSGEPYQGNALLPVFLWRKTAVPSSQIVEILLTKFEQTLLCVVPPVNIAHNVTFVVDSTKLNNFDDVKCDSMGSWKHSGTPKRNFLVTKDEDGMVAQVIPLDGSNNNECGDIFLLKRMFYTNNFDFIIM